MRNSGNTREAASLENCVENLNLSSGCGLQIITGNELWRKYGPQTLSKVSDFLDRVVKEKAKGMSMKKAVEQNLLIDTKPTLV